MYAGLLLKEVRYGYVKRWTHNKEPHHEYNSWFHPRGQSPNAFLGKWDYSAAALIVQEAGGKVTNFYGEDHFIEGHHIISIDEESTGSRFLSHKRKKK